MSGVLKNLFGKASAVKTTPKDSIVKLRESIEMLDKRERFLQTKIDAELKTAKTNATKNKRGIFSWIKLFCVFFQLK